MEKAIIKYASFTAILINALSTRSFRKFQVRVYLEKTKPENAPCRLNSMQAIKPTNAASCGLITLLSRHSKQNTFQFWFSAHVKRKERPRKLTWNDTHDRLSRKLISTYATAPEAYHKQTVELYVTYESCINKLRKETVSTLWWAFFTKWSDPRAMITMASSRLLKNF